MASVVAVRSVLATRLETIAGLRVREYVPGEISPPTATILPGVGSDSPGRAAIDYDQAFGGAALLNFLVKVAVSAVHDESGQAALDAYLASEGELSIKAAVEADMADLALDGRTVADYAQVPAVVHYGLIDWGGVTYLGADLHVEVLAR